MTNLGHMLTNYPIGTIVEVISNKQIVFKGIVSAYDRDDTNPLAIVSNDKGEFRYLTNDKLAIFSL